MFDIPRLYISQLALLYAVQPVRLCIQYYFYVNPLLYCYEQLMEYISEVEQLIVKVEKDYSGRRIRGRI
jgi:hypothetical protein